ERQGKPRGTSHGSALYRVPRSVHREKGAELPLDERQVLGARPGAGGGAPERRDRSEGHLPDPLALLPRVTHRKVEVRLRGHVQDRDRDGPERLLGAPVEPWRGPDVVLLPGAHLED